MKWILAPLLAERLKSKSSVQDSKFTLDFTFENDADDQIAFSDFTSVLNKMNDELIYKKQNKKIKTEKPIHYVPPKLEPTQLNFDRIAGLSHVFFFSNCR